MESIREIPGYLGYGVSIDGTEATVWSKWDRQHTRLTDTWVRVSARIDDNGYHKVRVLVGGKRMTKGVHQLVLTAYVGPCPPGMEGCHSPDPRRSNNHPGNLRWDTREANQADRYRDGNGHEGSKCNKAKLHEDDIPGILRMIDAGVQLKEIAARHGVGKSVIVAIKAGKIWRHVPGVAERRSAGRARGEANPRSKFTAADALAVIDDRKLGLTYVEIAKRRGMSITAAQLIGRGKTWRHVTGL